MLVALVMSLLWGLMSFSSYKKIKRKRLTKEDIVCLSGIFIIDFFKLEHRATSIIQHLHVNLVLLESVGWSYQRTLLKIANKLGETLIVLTVGCWLAYFAKEPILYIGIAIAAFVIVLQLYQGTIQKVKLRRQQILLELPIILTKMTLLIEAGETIAQAFIKSMKEYSHSTHPLHYEWNIAITMLQNGDSFPVVIERFSKRCSTQPVSVLSTYLLLNYARGGSYFVTSIQDLMNELWNQRKTIAKKKGEEASSKLVFPTIFILLLLMILIVTPAIRLMDII